jgi:tetratricopeptide (TPR) repeat protein
VLWDPLVGGDDEPGQVPIAPALLGTLNTSYVGREAMRDHLLDEWSVARAGACRLLLLSGESGVGKTRTAAEVARAAAADGALVLFGRCDEGLGVPYQPFVEALEHYVTHAALPALGRLPGELRRLVPDLGATVGPDEQPVASDPSSEEHRLFNACASWLADAARSGDAGLVLVVDDIHWATKPTLQLLLHVVRDLATTDAPVVILATYRDTDVDRSHPLAASIGDLRRLPGVERVSVDNLSADEVVAFIAAAAGHDLDDATTRLADAVYAETEGNPFFVGEVLRHLVETGGVRREGERWVVADPDHVAIPEGVRDVVGRRLDRLSPMANDVLSIAAAVGREFAVDVVVALVDVDEDATLEAHDEAVRARLVEETGVDQFRFAHALVRTTLYDELSATRRRRLHRRIADVLERERPDDVRALAYHCTEGGPDGGDLTRALRYTLAAAQEALDARAFADAELRFRSALDLLVDTDEWRGPGRVAAMCGLGECLRDQGDPAFREVLLDAARRGLELDELSLAVRAVLANTRGMSSVISGVDLERIEVIQETLDRAGPAPGPNRARLLGLLADELAFSGEHERRLGLADESVSMARALGDDRLLGEVLVTTNYASMSGDRYEQLVVRNGEAFRLADLNGDPSQRVLARAFFAGALLTVGELDESKRVSEDMQTIAADEGGPLLQWVASASLSRWPGLLGRLDEADDRNDDTLALGTELGQGDVDQWWGATALGLLWLRGENAPLADTVGEFARQYPLAPIWRCAHAWILTEAGRHEEARAVIDEHHLDAHQLIEEVFPFTGVFQLALAAFTLDDGATGATVIEALTPYRHCWAHYFTFVMGPITWALGMAYSVAGDHDAAIDLLEETHADLEQRGLRAHLPLLRIDLAIARRRRGTDDDLRRATTILTLARDAAESIGAPGVVRKVDALLT